MSISLVQSVGFNSNGSSNTTRTLNGVAAGNLLVTTFITTNPWGTVSITDNKGNTYTIIEGTSENGQPMGIAYAENVNGGNTTVTVGNGAVFSQCNFMEFSSGILGAALHLDTVLSAATGNGTSASSNSASTANNIELLVGTCQFHSGNPSAGSGFTGVGSDLNGQIAEYQITSSSGSYAATATGTSGSWGAVGVAFLILPLPVYNTIVGRFNNAGILVGRLLVPIWTSVNVTPVTVNSNTTSDQDLMSIIIPANTLNSVGRTLRGVIKGVYSTPIASTATIEIKVQLGSLTLLDITTAANAGSVSGNGFRMEFDIVTQTAGSSAKFESSGLLQIDLGAATSTAATVYADANAAVSSTLDSTVNQTLQVTVAFSSASGSNSCTQRQFILNTIN